MLIDARGCENELVPRDAAGNRVPGFDWLRVLGIVAVVWIHGCDTNLLARHYSGMCGFAVPGFVLLSLFLAQRSFIRNPQMNIGEFLKHRLVRLVPAYLAWSAAYVAVRALKSHFTNGSFVVNGEQAISWVFMGGASYQLYYVPMLMCYFAASAPLMKRISSLESFRPVVAYAVFGVAGISLALAGPLVVGYYGEVSFMPQQTLNMSWLAPIGCLLAFTPIGQWQLAAKHRNLPVILGMASVLLVLLGKLQGGAAAIVLLPFVAVLPRDYVPRFISLIASISYGIYLVHGFFVEGLQFLCSVLHVDCGCFAVTFSIITLSFVFSWIVCLGLRRYRMTRWLVC